MWGYPWSRTAASVCVQPAPGRPLLLCEYFEVLGSAPATAIDALCAALTCHAAAPVSARPSGLVALRVCMGGSIVALTNVAVNSCLQDGLAPNFDDPSDPLAAAIRRRKNPPPTPPHDEGKCAARIHPTPFSVTSTSRIRPVRLSASVHAVRAMTPCGFRFRDHLLSCAGVCAGAAQPMCRRRARLPPIRRLCRCSARRRLPARRALRACRRSICRRSRRRPPRPSRPPRYVPDLRSFSTSSRAINA